MTLAILPLLILYGCDDTAPVPLPTDQFAAAETFSYTDADASLGKSHPEGATGSACVTTADVPDEGTAAFLTFLQTWSDDQVVWVGWSAPWGLAASDDLIANDKFEDEGFHGYVGETTALDGFVSPAGTWTLALPWPGDAPPADADEGNATCEAAYDGLVLTTVLDWERGTAVDLDTGGAPP